MKFLSIKAFSIFVLASAFFSGGISAAEQQYTREALIPEYLGFYVHFSNTKAFFDELEKSPLGRLWNDEKMRKLTDDYELSAGVKDMLTPCDDDNTRQVNELFWKNLSLLEGEVIVSLSDEASLEPELLFISQSTPERYKENVELDMKSAEISKKDKFQTGFHEFQGVELFCLSKEDDTEECLYQAYVNGTAIQSADKEWIEKTVMTLKNSSGAQEPSGAPYAEIVIKTEAFADFLKNYLPGASDSEDEEDDQAEQKNYPAASSELQAPQTAAPKAKAPTKQDILNALGLGEISEIRLKITPSKDKVTLALTVDGVPKDMSGLWSILDGGQAGDFRLPYAPAETYSYQVSKINLKKFWAEIPLMLKKINPAYEMQFRGGLMMAQAQLGFDIGADIIDPFGQTFASCDYCDEDGSAKRVSAIQIADKKTMAMTLERIFAESSPIAASARNLISSEKYLDRDLYLIKIPDPQANMPGAAKSPAQKNPLQDVAFVIDGQNLYMGNAQGVRKTLQSIDSKSRTDLFFESQAFTKFYPSIPDQSVYWGIIVWEPFFKVCKNTFNASPEAKKSLESLWNSRSQLSDRKYSFAGKPFALNIKEMPEPSFFASYVKYSTFWTKFEDGKMESVLNIYSPDGNPTK